MKDSVLSPLIGLALVMGGVQYARGAQAVDFTSQVKPILEIHCVSCHGPMKHKGSLRLDTRAGALKGGDDGTALVPGKPTKSPLYTSTVLPADDDDAMPPKGKRLSKEETETLRNWIAQGAPWPKGVTLTAMKPVDFVTEIQPILEFHCVACHKNGHAKGKLRLNTRALALRGGTEGPAIVPGRADKSPLYTYTVLPVDDDDLMPPTKKGGPLPKKQIALLRDWINQGAPWPKGIRLVARRAVVAPGASQTSVIQEVYQKIEANQKVTEASQMKPYTVTIPGTTVKFTMVPIPGGDFMMGSPPNEPGRKPDEGPQHKVHIDPFWMGQCEVTWNQYELFMFPELEKELRRLHPDSAAVDAVSDAVTRPTKPYVEMSFGMGKDGYPAICMTQHAASTYCEWLSAKLDQYYRLPTEAEWEYACRAGTTTAYFFGNDPSKLGEYAWYAGNSNDKYHKVGKKKPNPWGLYDMSGNVDEWTLDQYIPDDYKRFAGKVTDEPWVSPTTLYPRVVRGGSWQDDPPLLRSAARRGSSPDWKMQDPQIPKSIWYHTDAQFVGFRIMRPLKLPPLEKLSEYWTNGPVSQ